MKQLILITIFLLAPLTAFGQCETGSVCVKQSTIDAATAAANELIEARRVIEAFGRERTATQAERESAARLIDRLNSVIAVQDKLNLEYTAVINLYKETVKMQSELLEKLIARVDAPKSGWAKFVAALKTIATLATGILLGRGAL